MWDFTHTCTPNNLPLTCESLPLCGFQDLSVGHEQVLLVPPCLWAFSFTHASSMSLHVSTPDIFYSPWEPHTSSMSSTIGNILSPLQLQK